MMMSHNCPVAVEVDEVDYDFLSKFKFLLDNEGYPVCVSPGEYFMRRLNSMVWERMSEEERNANTVA